MDIPLTTAGVTDAERGAVEEVLSSGQLKGGGQFWSRTNRLIESEFGAERALMTTSCTHALEMAALLLNVDKGDEVIIPSYTFPSTATAFARQGASIRFCEIEPDTLNMSPNHLEKIISSDTTVIVPVHYAGVGCDMEKILKIASKYDAAVVEDAAQGVNAAYKGKALGTIGDIGCYSFHETKSYSAGEGGALILNDSEYVERAEYILYKGTNYAKFSRGEVERYTWVDIGSSYVPSEMQAALAYAQLERRNEILKHRQFVFEQYCNLLSGIGDDGYLQLPTIPSDRECNYHLYPVLTRSESTRDNLMMHLRDRGIGAASHYEPLHSSRMGRIYDYGPGDLPRTERLAARLLRLPVNEEMDIESISKVTDEIKEFYNY